MIVLADTTPLISLMKIGHLDLVRDLFGYITIPHSVYEELTENPRFPDEARQINDADYIHVADGLDRDAVATFGKAVGLDRGESEAILLSVGVSAALLLMDEAKGRQVAHQMDLSVMGTIGMLIASVREGFLSKDEARESVDVLRDSGRHISDRLYRLLLEEIAE